jgi:hypothetical protein
MPMEAAAALLAAGVFAAWAQWGGGWDAVDSVLEGSRRDIYSTLASVAGALLGFVLTAVSIVLGFSSLPRLAVLRTSPHYKALYRIYFEATAFLSGATVCALVALVFDRDCAPVPLWLYSTLAFSLLSGVRVARCVWVLERLVELVITHPDGTNRDKK